MVCRWDAQRGRPGRSGYRRQVRLTGIDILRIADGRIVEHWGEANGLQKMQQIGAA
jgi:predicted SnoaL-like aldol condensation-catalyzing enzyme